jgi:hypothetical protein
MAEKVERLVDSFRARPERGEIVIIEVYQEFIDASHMGSNSKEWIAGLRRYQIKGGAYLNKVDDQTYKDPATGATFTTR